LILYSHIKHVANTYQYYIKAIRDHTTRATKNLSLAEKAAQGESQEKQTMFGILTGYINYRGSMQRTLAQQARKEWAGIEQILREAFTPALTGPSSERRSSTQGGMSSRSSQSGRPTYQC